jgi:hypothetical protein
MGQRLALVIGNTEYEDPTLAQLTKSDADVNGLTGVLNDSGIGSFDEVTSLINEPSYVVRRAIGRFFTQKSPDDLLLLYFSGHGVKDDHGSLYLAVKDTEHNLLHSTAISAASITHEMDTSRSKRQVLILDCCHSGAFAQGAKGVTQASVGTAAAFQGNGFGRVVLTATDSTQYAWEGDEVIGVAENSVFTHYLIQGLKTGEADADSDAEITLDELYDYVHDQVVQKTPRQTPGKWAYKAQGDIIIARNPNPARPAELAPELRNAIQNDILTTREWAVEQLTKLLEGRHKGLALAAQQALERMAQDDDSRRISELAKQRLQAYHPDIRPPQPVPPPDPVPAPPATNPEPDFQGDKAVQTVSEPESPPAADERNQEEERKQELLVRLYDIGMLALDTRDWRGSINAFQQVLDLDAGYRDAERLLNFARAELQKAEIPARNLPSPPAVNTSGQGRNAIVPAEIKKWHWGAFLLSWIWGLGNGTYIALLSLVPYAGLVMPFILGAKGNEWAWQNKRWDSVEHFQRVQQKWTQWGVWLLIGIAAFLILAFMMYLGSY